MYLHIVPNRTSPPAVLLRESWREGGKVKKRTLANLSALPMEIVELLRAALKGQKFIPEDRSFEIEQSLPHGHVAAVAGVMKRLGFAKSLGEPCRERDLVLAMIAGRVLEPASKLATSRLWCSNTLGETYGVAGADKEELYKALDWLLERQDKVERRLAKKHLTEGDLVLYDLTSTYVEGRKCPLARHGYSRDHRSDRMQIEFGLVTDRDGRPVAVEVFKGNTSDPMTLGSQIEKLRKRFGLKNVVVVGDRGMVTTTRIEKELKPAGYDWISALRHKGVRQLAEGPLQLGLFDEMNLAEIESPEYPGERLIACRNPWLAEESARKRTELLALVQSKLAAIQKTIAAGRLCDCGVIGKRVGAVLTKYRMKRYFTVEIAQGHFSFHLQERVLENEAALDGIYVLRSSVAKETMDAEETVRSYKRLAKVEKAFRSIKTGLDVRPIFHHLADRVRSHVFLCMLAYYVEWEMRRKLAPLMFAEEDTSGLIDDPIAPKAPSQESRRKTGERKSLSGHPLQSFKSLLQNLSTVVRNRCRILPEAKVPITFKKVTAPTPIQKEAFSLLEVAL